MRLLVTGPTGELSDHQYERLRDWIHRGEPHEMTLLHYGREGVEAAAVAIAKDLGWEVDLQEVKWTKVGTPIRREFPPPDHALVFWPRSWDIETTEIEGLADAGIPIDVRHL